VEITGAAQHEAWQARTLPPVEQLRPDLWSIPVPIPNNPLRYVNAYALGLAGGGLGLIDTGWLAEESWLALTAGLRSIGGQVEDVRGVLVTHMHLDHIGLAERVRQASGAWVALHPADARRITDSHDREVEASVAAQVDFLVSLGADRADAVSDVGPVEGMREFLRPAVPDRLLEDGDLADLPGWSLRAVHTPGHTPGHLCFAEEGSGLFFSGDHVLPRITPNVSSAWAGDPDPLRDFLASQERVAQHDPQEVLPAHEWRFRGLPERAAALVEHHEQRLADLLAAARAHPHSTPWQLAAHLTWSRSWDQYARGMRISAVTETDAHLRLLASRGLVVGSADGAAARTWSAAVR
jgi:glyoxylase-like metal-dependent hydrolase (beta-lactamase superfamily II)